jgi:hypothetical protein
MCEVNFEEIEYEVVVWVNLSRERDHWWAVVNAVMIFRFS